ncbi:MAG: response regulator, partial [Cyanobacteria bacterium P01_D01_bin.56]
DDYLTKPFCRADILKAVSTRLEKQAAAKAQANDDQVIALQQEIEEFRAGLDRDQADLFMDMRQHLNDTVVKLGIVTDILKTLPPGEQRERSLALVQSVCGAEIKMLAKIPNFEHLLETTT